jgi:ABC-type Mn2+/Zn2+ transport system ATPase subunit
MSAVSRATASSSWASPRTVWRAAASPTSRSAATCSRIFPCARTWRWAPGAFAATGRGRPAGQLSGGQQRLLEIERALLPDPALLLVDEPTVGLDPKTAALIYRRLRALSAGQRRTVLMVDQNVIAGTEIADHVYVVELGATKLEASRAEFDARYRATIGEWLI